MQSEAKDPYFATGLDFFTTTSRTEN